jgi:FHA domain
MPDMLPQQAVPTGVPVIVPTGQFQGQPAFMLDRLCAAVGVKAGSDIQLLSPAIRDVHALIVTTARGILIRNFAAPELLFVNGEAVLERLLGDGDDLQFAQFTFKFLANQAQFKPPAPPPPASIEINRQAARAIAGSVVLIGRIPGADIHLESALVDDRHAVLFAADGAWHVRDLNSQSGVFLNGQQIRIARLKNGDRLIIGDNELRLLQTAPGQAAGTSDVMLGGMPVVLPEVAPPPPSFGRVGVSFDAKWQHSAPAKSAPAAATALDMEESAPPRTPVQRKFPPVPKAKAAPVESPETNGEETDAEFMGASQATIHDGFGAGDSSSASFGEAVFGGHPLEGFAAGTDVTDAAQRYFEEVEDFANDKFWDQSDEEQPEVPLPPRDKDLTPPIPTGPQTEPPPVEAEAPIAEVEKTAPPPPAVRRPPISAAVAIALQGEPLPSRSWRPRAAYVALLSMAVAAGATWMVLPVHSTVEGHLAYLHAPAPGTPEWQAFEADQRQRLADDSTRELAAESLAKDHPETTAGFLQGEAGPFNAIIQAAQFQSGVAGSAQCVLRASGTDGQSDSERVAEVLKAMYQKDADLISAALSAQKALTDWEPNVTAKQVELDDLEDRIKEQQAVAAAGSGLAEKLAGIHSAAEQTAQQCLAAEETVQADQARLDALAARLVSKLPGPAPIKTTTAPAATQAVVQSFPADARWSELQREIDGAAAEMNGLKTQVADLAGAHPETIVADAAKRLQEAMTGNKDLFDAHPDLQASIDSVSDYQGRVSALLDQLRVRRHNSWERLQEFKGVIVDIGRRWQQAIYNGDPQLVELQNQLETAQANIDAMTDADISQEDREVMFHQRDQLERQIESRQRELNADDGLSMRDRAQRLIDESAKQLDQDRQFINDTLGTLQGQLGATPIATDLLPDQKSQLIRVLQRMADLAHAQSDYAASLADVDETASVVASLSRAIDDLRQRLDARRQILTAAAPASDAERQRINAEIDELSAQVANERKTMEAAHADFTDKAQASIKADLTMLDASRAQRQVESLTQARDVKAGDLAAIQRSRDVLQQTVDSTVDVKQPNEADVQWVQDDSGRKLIYSAVSALIVGAAVGGLMKMGGR